MWALVSAVVVVIILTVANPHAKCNREVPKCSEVLDQVRNARPQQVRNFDQPRQRQAFVASLDRAPVGLVAGSERGCAFLARVSAREPVFTNPIAYERKQYSSTVVGHGSQAHVTEKRRASGGVLISSR